MKFTHKMLVSIIIPVFNAEQYLDKCLNSVLNQTYENIEIILVNDGSTDNSINICKGFANRDSRIKLYDISNHGAGYARNYGIDNISGDLVMFVDSDDWISLDCVQTCMSILQNDKTVDCVIFPYSRETSDASNIVYPFDGRRKMIKGRYMLRRLFGLLGSEKRNPAHLDDLNVSVCKMYYSRFLKGVKYPLRDQIEAGEDLWFNISVFSNIKKIIYTTDTIYFYNKENANSITHSYSLSDIAKKENLYKFMSDYIALHNLGDDFHEALKNRRVFSVMNHIRGVIRSDISLLHKYKLIRKILYDKTIQSYFEGFSFSNLDFKWKLYFFFCNKRSVVFTLLLSLAGERLKNKLK